MLNTSTLSKNELLYATRRMSGKNQMEMAKEHGFHQTGISKMEKGEIPVNRRLEKHLVNPATIPEYLLLSILRRRYKVKLSAAAAEANIAPHHLGDVERGRVEPPEEYVNWLKKGQN